MGTCWHGPATYEGNNGGHLLASLSLVGSFNDTWVKRPRGACLALTFNMSEARSLSGLLLARTKPGDYNSVDIKKADTVKWQAATIQPSLILQVLTGSLLPDIVACLLHPGSSWCGRRTDPHWLLNSWAARLALVPPAQRKGTGHSCSLLGVLEYSCFKKCQHVDLIIAIRKLFYQHWKPWLDTVWVKQPWIRSTKNPLEVFYLTTVSLINKTMITSYTIL